MNTKTTVAVAAAALTAGVALYTTLPAGSERAETAVPEIAAPEVTVPEVAVPEIPALEIPALEIPAPETPGPRTAAVTVVRGDGVETGAAGVTVPETAALTPDQTVLELRRQLLALAADTRAVLAIEDPEVIAGWLEIYRDPAYADGDIAVRELAPGLRAIAEVRCPETSAEFDVLRRRLAYYRNRGYNALVLAFDTTEDPVRLRAVADYLRSENWRILIAYRGSRSGVFCDPELLRSRLELLGERAEALILGYRQTSLHSFRPDEVFQHFLIRAARGKNSGLAIIGQAYFGEVDGESQRVAVAVPEYCSAVLVVGLGYPRASTRQALLQLFPEIADHHHLIGLVVGERTYFRTLNDTRNSQAFDDAIKRRIELRFLNAGFASTLTYSSDGSDGDYEPTQRTDNLCREY